jgi:predicted transcriptional regulator
MRAMPDLPVSSIENAAATKDEDRRFRIVADGRADIAAGRVLTPRSTDHWIETVGTAHERPIPQSTLI